MPALVRLNAGCGSFSPIDKSQVVAEPPGLGFPTMAMAWEGGKKNCTRALRLHAICYGSFVASTIGRGTGTMVRGEPQVALLCGIVHTHSFTP